MYVVINDEICAGTRDREEEDDEVKTERWAWRNAMRFTAITQLLIQYP